MNDFLPIHPTIHRLDLGAVRLPAWHPRAADEYSEIFAYVVEHPDGNILFDCGCADDSDLINSLYQPNVRPLEAALSEFNLRIADIASVVLSHLHFDHCGQLRSVRGRPTFVQMAEIEAAQMPNYTVPDWATVSDEDRRIVVGDEKIAPGLEIIASPGHSPGHQCLVIRGDSRTTILGGQCCYCTSSFERSSVEQDNLFNEGWNEVALDSIKKLRSLMPDRLLLSHDRTDWTAALSVN